MNATECGARSRASEYGDNIRSGYDEADTISRFKANLFYSSRARVRRHGDDVRGRINVGTRARGNPEYF